MRKIRLFFKLIEFSSMHFTILRVHILMQTSESIFIDYTFSSLVLEKTLNKMKNLNVYR
jgi:hypothetical protein